MSGEPANDMRSKNLVTTAVESFYRRVFADETLRPFFETTDMDQLRARQRMFVSMLLGDAVPYAGDDIASAHAHARQRGLNDGHFDKFVHYFREALLEVGFDPRDARKITDLLETRRGTILNP